MKTYILSQLAKLKKTSSDLDEKAEVEKILCGKPWHIFNDGDVCETYLFEADGKLRIILGGKVSIGQWEYVEALKCVQLTFNDQQYMLQLSFSDQQLLAMKLYSGNEYCIMIEESQYAECKLKTLNDVQQYFASIAAKQEKQLQEQKLIEERRRKEQRLAQERQEQEKGRLEMEAERQRLYEEELNRIKNEILSAWINSDEYKDFCKQYKILLWFMKYHDFSTWIILGSLFVATGLSFALGLVYTSRLWLLISFLLFLGMILIVFYLDYNNDNYLFERKLKKEL